MVKVRRDDSTNNVPYMSYQETADAQDVIMWYPKQQTFTGDTDVNGVLSISNDKLPIIDTSHQCVVRYEYSRDRNIAKSITVDNSLYIGAVDGVLGKINLYTDQELTTSASSMSNITVTFHTLVPFDPSQIAGGGAGGEVTIGSALPAGSNNIGKVGVAYADGSALAKTDIMKYNKITSTAKTAVWTPEAGKSIVVRGIYLQHALRITTFGLGDSDIDISSGSTVIAHAKLKCQIHVKDDTNKIYINTGDFGTQQIDFGEGFKLPVDTPLYITSDATSSTGPLHVSVWGYEE